MESADTIDIPSWMNTPETKRVMAALGADKNSIVERALPPAMFVGGCVRNQMLGKAVDDLDIATIFTPQEVMGKLGDAGIKAIPTGIEHGTITAVIDKSKFEITTLRNDVETDGRYAKVSYTDNWIEDAGRRDFTMNTLLLDMAGRIYDPTGQGVRDLKNGRVMFVGEPKKRIEEDYLRILRFFRFYAYYGAGEPDNAALKACEAAADKISDLSKERIMQETLKILASAKCAETLVLMFAHGVLAMLSFEEGGAKNLTKLCELQETYGALSLPARLVVWGDCNVKNINKIRSVLLLSNAISKNVDSILEAVSTYAFADEHEIKTALYKSGKETTIQAVLIKAAKGNIEASALADILDLAQHWNIPTFPISGNDLIEQKGYEQGAALGKTLKELEQWWIADGFTADKAMLLARVDKV